MPQKKKIIHIIQSLENGGCENMLLRTLPLLQDFEHKIITLKTFGELTPKFVSAGITVETIHCRGFFDISGIRRLQKTVKEENPDIIITYLFHADMLGRLFLQLPFLSLRVKRSNPAPSIPPARGEMSKGQRGGRIPIIPFLRTTYNHPKYLTARILEWLTRPLVKQYLANSEAVKDFYVSHIGVRPEKITVIPNGIDVEYFDSIASDPKLKKSLGIDQNDFVIICVANLHPNKGHRYLLEAFEHLFIPILPADCHPGLPPAPFRGAIRAGDPGSIPSPPSRLDESAKRVQGGESKRGLKLLLVGDGEEKENLQNQIKNYQSKKNILFLGKRSDVPKLLKISNLFVLPTLFEGQSNAIMEAMATGLPIITTDIPENRVLIENNVSGILIPVQNSTILSQTIKQIRGNPTLSEQISEEAKTTIKNSFSLEKITKKWENALMEIIK